MQVIRTSNPTLNAETFESFEMVSAGPTMTLQGTVNRTFVLLALIVASAIYPWRLFFSAGDNVALGVQQAMPFLWGGLIGGLVLAMVIVFKREAAPYIAPLYAIAEGLFLGAISAFFEAQFKGIVVQAVGLTFGVTFVLLGAYTSGLLKPSENFKLGIVAATGGIMLFYLVAIVVSFFGITMPLIFDSGPIGIAFSLFVVGVAALNLVLDFDFIESGAERGAPKYMEWYGAFGLVVTLVWLYISLLRLLSKLRRN